MTSFKARACTLLVICTSFWLATRTTRAGEVVSAGHQVTSVVADSAATQPATGQAVDGATGGASSAGATAQPEVTEVVVTGSRIARPDYVSNTPLTTIGQDVIQDTSSFALETKLLEFPQFAGSAQSQYATGYFNSGAATINLRNLGENRNLVLLDGRRLQPSATDLAVDVNTIPAALIDNIEVITGGASAAYGADAVSGVVNFKLKRHFSGVQVDADYGLSERGDNRIRDASVLLGGNFAQGRGNAVVALSYSDRGAVKNADIPFYSSVFRSGAAGASYLASGYYSPAPNAPSQAALDAYFGQFGAPAGSVRPTAQLGFNNDAQSLFNITGTSIYDYHNPTYPRYAFYTRPGSSTTAVVQNFTADTFASLPLTRWSVFAMGNYRITDDIEAFSQAMYTHYSSTTEGGPPVAASGWRVDIPYDAEHPVPPALAALLDSRPDPTAPWSLNKDLSFMGMGVVDHGNDVFQVLAGLRGAIPGIDASWELTATHGETQLVDRGVSGFASLARYTELMKAPNYGANYQATFGHCTSGISPFGEQNGAGAGQFGDSSLPVVSADCIDYLNPYWTNTTRLHQDFVELSAQGAIARVPAGEARFALGVDYRSDSVQFAPDSSFEPNSTNYEADIIGQFGNSAVSGLNDVKEVYGEVLLPLLKDLPLVKRLELNPAYRYSDYNHAGGASSYKIDLNWQVVDAVRVRGGYQRAVRAPNVVEQFGPPTLVFDSAVDACQSTSTASYANIPSNPNRGQVQRLCRALMGAGAPPITDPVNDPYGLDTYLGSASNSLNSYPRGNPNLKPEIADTFTAGVVFSPKWELPADLSFTSSIDYYNIDIKGAIGYVSANLTYQLCFNANGVSNPSYDPSNIYCQTIQRFHTPGSLGVPTGVFSTYLNQGGIRTDGVDAQADMHVDAGPGIVGLSVVVNYLNSFTRRVGPGAPSLEYAGFAGGYYRWKSYTDLSYQLGPVLAGLRWRHLPSAEPQDYLVSSCASTICYADTPSYDVFDLHAMYRINSMVSVHGGVDNLLNRDPPVTRGIAGTTDVQNYDIIGRRYYLGISARF